VYDLYFANDIDLITGTLKEFKEMTTKLEMSLKKCGKEINRQKQDACH
jgi:hypothetical protein